MKSKITSKTKRILAFFCAVVLVATTFLGHWYTKQAEAATDAEPVWLDGYENVTIKDFKDADDTSVALTPGTGTSTGYKRYKATEYTSFDNVLLSMKVTFAAGTYATRLDVGGGASSGYYTGLWVFPSDATGTTLKVQACPLDSNNFYGMTDGYQTCEITPAEAGVEKFVGEEFILQLAFDFGEESDGKADLTLGVYINGKLAKSHTFTGCNTAKFGSYLNFINGVNITYDNVIAPIEPVILDGFDNLTISDFDGDSSKTQGTKLTAGEYTTGYYGYVATGHTNFDKKLVSLNVTFEGGTYANSLMFGGNGTWVGFNLYPSEDGTQLVMAKTWASTITSSSTPTLSASTAGLDSFLGEEFLLQMSFEYGEEVDGKADLILGIYINGELYNNEKFTIADCAMSATGARLAMYPQTASQTVTIGEEVEFPIEPVTLDGFDNLTISDFEGDGWRTEGQTLTAGEYTAAYYGYAASGLTNFDKKLVSLNVTFKGGTYANSLLFGGNETWVCFNLYPSEDGSQLVMAKTWGSTITSSSTPTLSAATAGVESFLDKEFLLQMSFEYGEEVDGKADLTLGIYINGELYNNEKFTIADCAMSATGARLAMYPQTTSQTVIIGKEVEFPVVPGEEDPFAGYEEVTIKDFIDGSGNVMEEKVYTCFDPEKGTFDGFTLANHSSFDGKVLSMNVKFKDGGSSTRIDVAGSGKWKGLMVYPSATGDMLNILASTGYGMTDTNQTIKIDAATAGVSSFIDTQFLLQLTFDFGTVDSSTNKADLTLGVYINGNLCNSEDSTITGCNIGTFGNYMGLYRQSDISRIIVGSINEEFPEDYEAILANFEEVTVKDFVDGSGKVMEEKAYTCLNPTSGTFDGFTLANHTSFDGKVLSMNLKFKEGGATTRIDVAGTKKWQGLMVYPTTAGDQLYILASIGYGMVDTNQSIVIDASAAGISSFIDNRFLLRLTFTFGEADANNQADLTVGAFINGVLCGSKTFTGCHLDTFGNYMGLYRQSDESTIIVGSIKEEFPADPGIQPSARYEKITFGQFGILDGTYPYVSGSLAVTGTAIERTTLDKTVICGEILLEGSNTSQIIWGGQTGWNGLRMFPSASGTMRLVWYDTAWDEEAQKNVTTTHTITTLDSEVAGVAFVGEKYNIMLSSELVDNGGDGNVNDIKIGIWFNGVLYNQQYFYATDLGDKYGNRFAVYCGAEGDKVTLGSVHELLIQPSEELKKVSYNYYGIEDGEYTETKGALKTQDTVAGTVLCGDIELTITGAQYCQIVLGGNSDSAWNGIRLLTNSADKFNVMWYEGSTSTYIGTVEASKAGVDFNGEKFELMMSTELIDNDGDGNINDIKFGIWFNGFLYQNQYFIIADKGELLGNYFLVSSEHAILGSIPEVAKLPDESFDKITFSDFGLETQEVACDSNVVAQGTASEYTTLDKVVFSGDFRMSEDGNYQIIYGGNSWWDGLRVMISSNVLNVSWYKADEAPQRLIYITDPTTAGVTSFTKNTFNLKISTELVDDDGDGNKNDIKVGVWIDNILCEYNGNDYHIVKDWGDQLLNGFSIYGDESDEVQKSVLIRNDVKYQSNPYYYEEIAEYRNPNVAPEAPEGYVFSGWYEDEDYTTWIGTDVTSGSAWAKFVEEDVLSAKTQVKVDSNGKVTSGSTSLRLATTVDSLQYRKISFYLQKQKDGTYGNEVDAATLSNEDGRLVYEKLYYIGSNTETMSYKPNAFSWQSAYFKTFTLTDIPESDYGVMIKATPFWVTMDGTIVRGKTLETCVSNYEKPGTNLSTAVSVDFLGEDVMPITGYFGPYMISDTSDPLLLPDYNTDTYFKMIADSGVNVLSYSSTDYASHPDYVIKQLELGEKYGVGIYVNDSSIKTMSESEMLAQIKNYSGYKSFCGMYLVDEPGTSDYCSTEGKNVSDYSNAAAILSKNNIPYYSNMYPVLDAESAWWEGIFGSAGIDDTDKEAYISYIEEYYNGLNPEVISYDYYPFSDTRLNEDGSVNQSLYFWNLDAVRDKARATGKPFWTFVQAGSQWNDASNYFESNTPYYPTEGQFMWNANTALAFGTQGIQYFPVVQPKHFAYGKDETHWDFNRNGLIGAWGNKTEWYDYALSLNEHIAAIDGVLMNSYSKQMIAIGNATSATSGLTDVTTTASYNNVLTNATGNALIGCFDYCGKTALYVVNFDYANAGDVTLTFNGTQNITRIENAVTTETSTSSLTLNMEAGEGILLVIE